MITSTKQSRLPVTATEGKLTLWKIHVLVAGCGLVFALLYWLLGPLGGSFMLILLLPLWTFPVWLILSDRSANALLGLMSGIFLLFLTICGLDRITRATAGFGLPFVNNALLIWAWLYFLAGVSVARSGARWFKRWRSWDGA
jgi:hypothetical protein